MWIVYACLSAFFAGLTSILAKCGIKKTDSHAATAIRTIVVLIFACIMVFVSGSQNTVFTIDKKTWVFLILSGIATGASWLCYFKALQIGDINKVVPIDKSSTVFTMLFALIFLHEGVTWTKIAAIIAITVGTLLMIKKNEAQKGVAEDDRMWIVYAVMSAVFASLTSILAKIGISGVESNLGTAIRTAVVLVMAWIVVFVTGKQKDIKTIPKKELNFICLSGIATGASWLCYYKALREGLLSVVVPIDKLSIIVTIIFSYIVFKEKLSKKAFWGLILIVAGTLIMVLKK